MWVLKPLKCWHLKCVECQSAVIRRSIKPASWFISHLPSFTSLLRSVSFMCMLIAHIWLFDLVTVQKTPKVSLLLTLFFCCSLSPRHEEELFLALLLSPSSPFQSSPSSAPFPLNPQLMKSSSDERLTPPWSSRNTLVEGFLDDQVVFSSLHGRWEGVSASVSRMRLVFALQPLCCQVRWCSLHCGAESKRPAQPDPLCVRVGWGQRRTAGLSARLGNGQTCKCRCIKRQGCSPMHPCSVMWCFGFSTCLHALQETCGCCVVVGCVCTGSVFWLLAFYVSGDRRCSLSRGALMSVCSICLCVRDCVYTSVSAQSPAGTRDGDGVLHWFNLYLFIFVLVLLNHPSHFLPLK